jgi:hypothetical protein
VFEARAAVGDLRTAEDQSSFEALASQSTEHVSQERFSPDVGPESDVDVRRGDPLRALEDGPTEACGVEVRLVDCDDEGADVDPSRAQGGEDRRVPERDAWVLVAGPVEVDENDASVRGRWCVHAWRDASGSVRLTGAGTFGRLRREPPHAGRHECR